MKRAAVVFAAVLILALVASAQDGVRIVRTSISDVKPDMVNEWMALQEEVNRAFQKAGLPSRTVYEVMVGPMNQFLAVTHPKSLAEFDEPAWGVRAMGEAGWQRWVNRLTKCMVSRRVVISHNFTRSAIPLPDGKRPRYMQVDYLENVPGKGRQLMELLEKELLPAYEKAGITGAWVSRRSLGTNGREILLGRSFDKWADVEDATWLWAPVIKALGQEKADEIMARGGPMIARRETHVYRYRADLSFGNE